MKGLVFLGKGKMDVREFPDPQAGPGQVVVKMKAAGICGSDLHFLRPKESPSVIQGHEPSGVVEAVGDGVHRVKVGDRVSMYHWTGCGHCRFCLSGFYQQCEERKGLAWHLNGADADYLVMDEKYCMLLPDELDFMDGAIIACAGGTAFSLLKKIDLSGATTLALFGVGPVGLCVLLLAKAYGARVIAVDVNPERLAFAEKLGADETIDASQQDTVEQVMKLTGGRGAERVIDTSGSTPARAATVHCAAANGKIGIVGMRNPENPMDLDPFIRKQLILAGSYTFPITLYPEIAGFLIEHQIHFSDIVTRTFRLDEAEEVYRLFESGSVGKFMFVWD